MNSFFSVPSLWKALGKELRARPLAPPVPGPLRVWVASDSVAADGYSVAILLRESLDASGVERDLKIFATSRDNAAVREGRLGRFGPDLARALAGDRLHRFFKRDDRGFRVDASIRRLLVFSVHRLAEDPPFTRLDALICPAPLGGFPPPARRRILERFAFALRSGGLLALSEEPGRGLLDGFERLDKSALLFRKSAAPRRESQLDLVAGVSHELCTPFSSILGYVETLKSGGNAPRHRKEFLDAIERNARRLLRTVEGLVSLADSRSGRFLAAPVPVAKSARAAASTLRAAAREAGVTIKVEIPPDLRVRADADDLPHIFENLLAHAVKFKRRGGRVVVVAERQRRLVAVFVARAGRGLPADCRKCVAERFNRCPSARSIKGSGLGLAIARDLIEANQGRISMESVEGSGAAFRFCLPAA